MSLGRFQAEAANSAQCTGQTPWEREDGFMGKESKKAHQSGRRQAAFALREERLLCGLGSHLRSESCRVL